MTDHRRLLQQKISTCSIATFDEIALAVFHYQARHNALYREYLQLLNLQNADIQRVEDIPFLPISFFKNYSIKTGDWPSKTVFTSSGTTGDATSRHHVRQLDWYVQNTRRGFEFFHQPVSEYCVLALLPSYLERSGSSLIAMADYFIQQSVYDESGFFLYNTAELVEVVKTCMARQLPVILLGVSFALLDLAEQYQLSLNNTIVMETGGMKGRRREMTRAELHSILQQKLGIEHIHSEYGMTELFSQAYSKGGGVFYPAPTMKVLLREITDPLSLQKSGRTGVINVIDLANLDTISFIATDDLGRLYPDGGFEVLGRLDASDVRGCNLLVADVE